MSFIETVRRARDLLREEGRITLRGLSREFDLDDAAVEELVEELVDAQQVAGRDGKVVVWLGAAGAAEGAEPAASRAVLPPAEPQAERRRLTVMFCDLVGSAELTQRLGAEAYRQVVAVYQACGAKAITRYEGHVAQYLGDGLLVYFGYPQAHEDDAERAVRAGREILRGLATLNPGLEAKHAVRLSVRVGIHTGPVVVGEMGSGEKKETLALGDTPTIASRLQGVAEPESVVISDATLRLVAGLFVTEDRGTPEQCYDQIVDIQTRTGGEAFVGVFSYAGMPYDVAEANLRLFVSEVMPELKRHVPIQDQLIARAGVGASADTAAFRLPI